VLSCRGRELLPLAAPWAASPPAASHGLSAEQPASYLGTGASRTGPGGGVPAGTLGGHVSNHSQNH